MGIVKSHMSMSLDGFIAGPNDGPAHPLGEGGERLHKWVYGLESWRERQGIEGGESNADAEVVEEQFRNDGASIMGRGMFTCGEEPWGEEPPFHMPVFVVTHDAREPLVRKGGTTFTFVTDGVESALRQAKEAAGDRDVSVAGGATIVQQLFKSGLLDELYIHISTVLLGKGRRLFENMGPEHIELERTRVIGSPDVTHIRYRPVKKDG